MVRKVYGQTLLGHMINGQKSARTTKPKWDFCVLFFCVSAFEVWQPQFAFWAKFVAIPPPFWQPHTNSPLSPQIFQAIRNFNKIKWSFYFITYLFLFFLSLQTREYPFGNYLTIKKKSNKFHRLPSIAFQFRFNCSFSFCSPSPRSTPRGMCVFFFILLLFLFFFSPTIS